MGRIYGHFETGKLYERSGFDQVGLFLQGSRPLAPSKRPTSSNRDYMLKIESYRRAIFPSLLMRASLRGRSASVRSLICFTTAPLLSVRGPMPRV